MDFFAESRDKDRRHKHRHRSSSSESGVDVKKEDIDDDYYRHAAGDSRLKRAEENDRRLKRLQAHRDDKNEIKELVDFFAYCLGRLYRLIFKECH